MNGEENDEKSIRAYDDEQILGLLRRTQELEKQKTMLIGVILISNGNRFPSIVTYLGQF